MCCERTCQTVTFLEHSERCVLPGRVWVCGRSAGRCDSCASREPLSWGWPASEEPLGTPCGPLSSRACTAASEPRPPLQACGYPGSMRGVWHHQDRRRQGPRELTGITDHSREGSSHGPLAWTWCRTGLAPCTRMGGRARKRLPCGGSNRDARSPFQGTARTPLTTSSKTQPVCWTPVTSSHSPRDAPGEVRRRAGQDATGHRGCRGIPSCHIRLLLRAWRDRLTKRQQERLREAFTADEAHISVEVAYHCAQQVRDVFHQATPTHGRHLATQPHEAPTNVPHPRNHSPGPDPTHVEGRPLGLPRHRQSQQHTPPKPPTDTIERGKRTTRGYPNPTNHQPRIPLNAKGLDAPTHTQL